MKQQSGIILAFSFLLLFYVSNIFAGDGEIVNQDRDVSSFTEIDISNGVDAVITQGKTIGVKVKADVSYIDKVITTVENNRLKIRFEGKHITNKKLTVYITVTDLSLLSINEGCDVFIEGILQVEQLTVTSNEGCDIKLNVHAGKMACSANEGSDIKLEGVFKELNLTANEGSDIKGKVEASVLCIRANEGSDVNLEGTSTDTKIMANEGSDVKVSGMQTVNCDIQATEATDVHVFATGVVNVNASDASDVLITGKPKTKNIIASDDSDVKFN